MSTRFSIPRALLGVLLLFVIATSSASAQAAKAISGGHVPETCHHLSVDGQAGLAVYASLNGDQLCMNFSTDPSGARYTIDLPYPFDQGISWINSGVNGQLVPTDSTLSPFYFVAGTDQAPYPNPYVASQIIVYM